MKERERRAGERGRGRGEGGERGGGREGKETEGGKDRKRGKKITNSLEIFLFLLRLSIPAVEGRKRSCAETAQVLPA